MRSLERKLVVTVLALFLALPATAGAILLVLYRRGMLEDPATLALAVGVAAVALLTFVGVLTHGLGRLVVRRLRRIQLGMELITTVNPDHRLVLPTGDELQLLAEEVNRMADRMGGARHLLEEEIVRATRALDIERGKFSAVLEAIGDGVVLAAVDGRVVLANPAALTMLGATTGGLLGRSLFDFVDRDPVAHFLERLRTSPAVAHRFAVRNAAGALFDAVMTSFAENPGVVIGVVLVLRDLPGPARPESARERLDDAPRPRRVETVSVTDLMAATLRRLRLPAEAGGVEAVVIGPGRTGAPALRVDVSAMSVALAHLLDVVVTRRATPGKAWLRSARHGHVVLVDVGCDGALPPDVNAVLDDPMGAGSAGRSVRDIVDQHFGEVWSYAADGGAGYRLTVPIERPADASEDPDARWPRVSFVGAGLVSGVDAGDRGERPAFYDFSLIQQMERHLSRADLERDLRELAYVAVDVETTGLDPAAGDRIVSLAGVRVRHGAVKRHEVFDALVNPGRPIPASSVRFHGITDTVVADAPPIDVVLPAFLRFADGTVLLGHQVWFDLGFLERDARRGGLRPLTLTHPVLDTLLLSRFVHRPLPAHTLEAVADRLGVTVRGRHSALGDALATADVFVLLLELLGRRGIVTLGQALDACRRSWRRG